MNKLIKLLSDLDKEFCELTKRKYYKKLSEIYLEYEIRKENSGKEYLNGIGISDGDIFYALISFPTSKNFVRDCQINEDSFIYFVEREILSLIDNLKFFRKK